MLRSSQLTRACRRWQGISTEKKETIRGFLVLFNCEILKRAHKHFNFRNGSIGNFFLTGARLFFGSLEAAIFLFSSITAIREPTHVLPAINTNHTAAIAARLEDGHTLKGQCEISHPGRSKSHTRMMNPIDAFSRLALPNSPSQLTAEDKDEENVNLVFSKTSEEKLSAPIQRIYYMNEYGQEIYPLPNPKVIEHLTSRKFLVYSIGSLYTSILPCLILRGVGSAIAHSPSLRYKILMLNGTPDRETDGYTAVDFIGTITNALNESQLVDARRLYYDTHAGDDHGQTQNRGGQYQPERPVDHGFRQWPPLVKPARIEITTNDLLTSGEPSRTGDTLPSSAGYTTPPFPRELVPNAPPSSYITHLIYLSNSRKIF